MKEESGTQDTNKTSSHTHTQKVMNGKCHRTNPPDRNLINTDLHFVPLKVVMFPLHLNLELL